MSTLNLLGLALKFWLSSKSFSDSLLGSAPRDKTKKAMQVLQDSLALKSLLGCEPPPNNKGKERVSLGYPQKMVMPVVTVTRRGAPQSTCYCTCCKKTEHVEMDIVFKKGSHHEILTSFSIRHTSLRSFSKMFAS